MDFSERMRRNLGGWAGRLGDRDRLGRAGGEEVVKVCAGCYSFSTRRNLIKVWGYRSHIFPAFDLESPVSREVIVLVFFRYPQAWSLKLEKMRVCFAE